MMMLASPRIPQALILLTEIAILKPAMFNMLENHYTGGKAIPCTIPDSLSNPIFSAPGVILQLEFIHLLQNDIYEYMHYLHFMQQRQVNKELSKDSSSDPV